ncbi:hypothetical protein [Aliiroseovarius sediminis]|uniref:baeRF3 domain-containing protein n=1 Tax=Aliiroseovarius sediminis TaxID=2925839 RepID=UPI001F59E276|nr:hypothetical protein [Aliiroseovarius sediminis]MCI2394823.1 hypothetical protein [Aliiroseovarius sediminis]
MNELEHDYKDILLADHDGPCISLYQPTHRTFPDRKQDPIRFGNLLKEVKTSLERQYGDRDIDALLRPFHALEDDAQFWNHTLDGIAVFATPAMFKVYNLRRTVKEKTIVASSFHTKPLVRILQSADRFNVLGISRHSATLFEGNRYALDEVTLNADFPAELEDVILADQDDPERTKRAHGRDGSGHTTRHGMNVRRELTENETRQFFRAVDEAVAKTYSKPSSMPLVLAALSEHHHMFRDVSDNPALLEQAVDVDPASVTAEDLRARAWDIVLPRYLERLDGLVEQFGTAQANDRGSADLTEIGKAVSAGRIATLLIDADRVVPGRFDPETGHITFARLEDPDVDDLLDDLGEHTLRSGGEVVIVPPERMPSETGIAAIFRF